MKILKELLNEFSIFPQGPIASSEMNPEDDSIEFGTDPVYNKAVGDDSETPIEGDPEAIEPEEQSSECECTCPCCSSKRGDDAGSEFDQDDVLSGGEENDLDDDSLAPSDDEEESVDFESDKKDEFKFI